MANVSITKKPSLAVKSLKAPVRKASHKMRAEWKIPSALVSGSKADRAEGLEIDWILDIKGKDPKQVKEVGNERLNHSEINLNSFKVGGKTYTRASFYPFPKKKKLNAVSVIVTPTNRKGKGKAAKQSRKFEVPKKPNTDALTFNTENGRVTAVIETDAGNGYNERYDTKYTMTVTNPFVNDGKPVNMYDEASTSTSITKTYDAQDYMQLNYDQVIKIVVTAKARGYAGDSKESKRTMYVSYPAQASIEGVDVDKSSTGKCTVRIKTNSTTEHPVDKVRLDFAADVIYDDADDIPEAEWTASEIIDNKNCTALSIATSELIPSRGNHTFVRVTTFHLHEGVLYRYSEPKMITELEKATTPAAQIDIDILEARSGADGKSAVVWLGWNKDGQDDFTGTELSWSDSPDTWRSTEEPNTHQFTWSDGQITYGGVTYYDSAEITIRGLDEGEMYYIKARRYLEAEIEQFSEYAVADPVKTNEKPESIVANCQTAVADGDPLGVYWSLVGNGLQTEWKLSRIVDGDADGTIIAEGVGSIGYAKISAERLKEMATDGVLSFIVEASTGSGFIASELQTVQIVERPTLSITVPSTMTAQNDTTPFSFTAESNSLCDLLVTITSQGTSGQFPQGYVMQAAGDTIHSDVYSPEWTSGEATITIPIGLDFWDLGNYTVSVVAVDRDTGLRTDPPVEAEFTVLWANQAVSPEEAVTLTVIDTTDEDGDHRQAVKITLTAPENSSSTDVYDIYRMDLEKPNLIGQGFPLACEVTDEYAPFSMDTPLSYRIALRTVDGDVEFADIEYTAECKNIRFDWATGSLELPYGNAISDSFKKDAQIRQHMDGGSSGYWNPNIERRSSLNSSIIKIMQPQDIVRARLLARYAGAVFVRLPNGSAFEANVQVTDMSVKNKAVTAVAFDATEIGLTEEFILPTPYTLEEEEEEVNP